MPLLAIAAIVWLLKSLTADEWKALLVVVGVAIVIYAASLPSRRAASAARAETLGLSAVDPLLSFRAEFPILERTTYLVSNSLGAMPRGVPERLAEYVDQWAELGVRAWAKGWWTMPVTVGDEIAPLIGAGQGEVAMLPNVTIAQTSVLSALDYTPPRDTIVMTELDFPSVRYVYDELATRLGARIVVVPSDDGVSIDTQRMHRRDRRAHAARGDLARVVSIGVHHGRRGDLRDGHARSARSSRSTPFTRWV